MVNLWLTSGKDAIIGISRRRKIKFFFLINKNKVYDLPALIKEYGIILEIEW